MQSEAVIERIWQVGGRIQRIELAVDRSLREIRPGQSLLALSGKNWNPYLREQWLPVEVYEGQVVVERTATDNLYQFSPGQVVDLIGPVGESLPWIGGGNKHLLLIALETIPTPLLMLAQEAVAQTAEVAFVMLGSAIEYPFEGIPAAVEVITGEEHDKWDDREATINWADQIFAVVDQALWLDHFSNLFHLVRKIKGKVSTNFMFGVFNLPLPCGTGACTACMIRCKTGTKLTCKQGPAVDLTEVQLL